MPRANRICFPGAVYHIFQRGNNKQDIFLDDADRLYFLKLLAGTRKMFNYLLHCYVLMNNHFHMTIETPSSTPISEIMQSVSFNYAVYFNKRHERIGHLFQDRFKGIMVEKDDYLLRLSRYVHLNPVTAYLVEDPVDWPYSSYLEYLSPKQVEGSFCEFRDLISMEPGLYKKFVLSDKEKRKQYDMFGQAPFGGGPGPGGRLALAIRRRPGGGEGGGRLAED